MRRNPWVPLAIAIALLAGGRASAGTSIEFGAVVGHDGGGSETVVGLRGGPVHGGHPGIELALSVSPGSPAMLLGDLNFAVAFGSADGGPVILARGGLSALTGSLIVVAGFDVGGGVILPIQSGFGLRGDIVHRMYSSEGDSFAFTTMTVGLVWWH